jgi:hypothetical protein
MAGAEEVNPLSKLRRECYAMDYRAGKKMRAPGTDWLRDGLAQGRAGSGTGWLRDGLA